MCKIRKIVLTTQFFSFDKQGIPYFQAHYHLVAMNPSEKGWLNKYLAFRAATLSGVDLYDEFDFSQPGECFLYDIVQPTGLMYGYPIHVEEFSHPKAFQWDEKARMKVLLAESFLQTGLYLVLQKHGLPDDPTDRFPHIVDEVHNFYRLAYPHFNFSDKTLLGRPRASWENVEYALERRTQLPTRMDSVWASFFHNILLFFDLIAFVQWMEDPSVSSTDLPTHNLQVRMNLLKLIAASAWADGDLHKEEHALYDYFLQSAKLSIQSKREARIFVLSPVTIDTIDFTVLDNWLLKKYFLELAVLVIWSDLNVSKAEELFLLELTQRLKLPKAELEHSALAIESFVVEHWDDVHYLQQKQNYRKVSDRLIRRMNIIVRKNQHRIRQEIAESRQLVRLLAKSTKQELTPEEKEKVRIQLLDILKTIPAFALLILPGSFLTLPILMKIVPKHILFPSSFLEED